jgi:hypothetical protein
MSDRKFYLKLNLNIWQSQISSVHLYCNQKTRKHEKRKKFISRT